MLFIWWVKTVEDVSPGKLASENMETLGVVSFMAGCCMAASKKDGSVKGSLIFSIRSIDLSESIDGEINS